MNGCPITQVSANLTQPSPNGFAGPAESFNFLGGVQASFPWMPPEDPSMRGQRIQTIKSDGVVLGGYTHSIIRPFDTVHVPKDFKDGRRCDWPTYAASKYQKWCNEEDAINYYGMRPLVTPDTYNGWLTKLFETLVNPGHEVSNLLNAELKPKVFCDPSIDNYGSEQTVVMKWIMKKVAEAVAVIPQMKKNGPWKYEQFHHTDVQFYAFSAKVGGQESSVYRILFNLYNPLRSTATLVECVVLNPQNTGKYVIAKMDFVNSGCSKGTDEGVDSYAGFNLGSPKAAQVINLNTSGLPSSSTQDWNYGNVLQKQKFNEFGFFEPGLNKDVHAGVPDTLKAKLRAMSNTMLMEAETPRYSGLDMSDLQSAPTKGRSSKEVPINGMPHMVKNNPELIYNMDTNTGRATNVRENIYI